MDRNLRFSPKTVNNKSAVSAVESYCEVGDVGPMKTNPPHLRAWRKHMQMTQVELANILGTDHTTLGRYERGTLRVDDSTFRRIAEIYGVSVAELSAHPSEREKSQNMHRIMTAWAHLDPEDAKSLADMAQRFASYPKK